MRILPVALLPVCLLLSIAAASTAQEEAGWRPLSDGESLAGWHAVGDGTWTVEDGAFVGRAHNEKLYGLLVSDKAFKDFTVKFKFLSATGDSGFYVRTVIKPPEKAHGLQVQVGPQGSGTGGVYESYGRAWMDKPTAEEEAKFNNVGQWNEMVISAKGGDVVVHVNGIKAAEIRGDASRAEGHLALQMHAGCEMVVKFKDLQILEQ